MRIRVLSDVHAEFARFVPPELGREGAPTGTQIHDVVVLAGDIHNGKEAVHWAATTFPDVPVVFVPGNHEYYNGNLGRTAIHMRRTAAGTNVRFLDNDECVIDGVRFLGATLWTDFALYGAEENRAYAIASARRCMADFSCITYASSGWFTPEQSVSLHQASVAWLSGKLGEPFPGKTVVVTHHAPTWRSVHPRFAQDILTAAFVSDLDHLMGSASLWIHGHVHDPFDYRVRGTRVVCNPRGYAHERNGFNPQLVVEI